MVAERFGAEHYLYDVFYSNIEGMVLIVDTGGENYLAETFM